MHGNHYLAGLGFGLLAYLMWGFCALYFRQLSRILKQLSADGIVSVSSGNIVRIPNCQKLQRFVEAAGKTCGRPRRRIAVPEDSGRKTR